MRKITVVGGGNIGTAMLAMLSKKEQYEAVMYSSKKDIWNETLKYKSMAADEWKEAWGYHVTDNLENAAAEAEYVFITLPSFLREDFVYKLGRHISENCKVIFVPGCGGVELFCKTLIKKGAVILGIDRVPCVARLAEYGKSIEFEWKNSVRLATVNKREDLDGICSELSDMLSLKVIPLDNYLSVTLTPSNQIMHPSRIYSIMKDKDIHCEFDHNILFYREWTDQTSEIVFRCSDELMALCKKLRAFDVIPLDVHYESDTPKKLTKKIRSILSFKNIRSPMVQLANGNYVFDVSSRYFTEDFPYGVFILKSLSEICNLKTPMFDELIRWYEELVKEDIETNSDSRNSCYANIAKVNGIFTREDIFNFYNIK